MRVDVEPRASDAVERLAADARSPWWGEHRSRYRLAQGYCSGMRVLDVACGSGYGTAMLAEAGAALTLGCDVALSGIDEVLRTRELSSVAFVVGDGMALPFPAESFDLVVSFETLEHLPDGPMFVRELRRIMRPGGSLLLSTPNAEVTARYPRNPFHVREFTAPELAQLLGDSFSAVELYGQRLKPAYPIAPFLPGYERASGFAESMQLILWKILRRLPRRAGDGLSRALLGRNLYPGEQDYYFSMEMQEAHVLVARCIAG